MFPELSQLDAAQYGLISLSNLRIASLFNWHSQVKENYHQGYPSCNSGTDFWYCN